MRIEQDHIVVAAIVAVLLLLETGIRLFENDLSGNLNHINEIPDIVERYTQDQRPKILFLGNSLINEAVDVEQLDRDLSGRYLIDKITPDATSVWDWSMIMNNQVIPSGSNIDYVVMGFAWGLLSDQYLPNPSRLGGYFAGLDDLGLLYDYGMRKFSDYSEFLFGWISKLFVNREAVRNKVLVNAIPYYEQFVRMENQAGRPDEAEQVVENSKVDDQYTILNRFLDELDKNGTKLIIIAMPIEDRYSVDAGLAALLQERALEYLDYREFFVNTESVYKDGAHLNEKGKRIFTSALNKLFRQET